MRGFAPERSFTRDGRIVDMRTASLQELIDAVLMVCGTPDQCYRQITDFIEYTGGMGNLLVMAQAGFLDHHDTVDSLTLLAREIMPRLKNYKQPVAPQAVAAA
jgi:alkanesulfonate monooxygenase SsuD/methylene tetrahydromethanopterin reductase-like flavin-dependent oxidoreductase (luciferase family)